MPEPRPAVRRPADDLFLFRLNKLSSVAGGPLVRLCEGRYGITRREWRLIVVLAQEGSLLSSDLADRARVERARTSRAVTQLLQKGLITRQPRPNDRRQVEIELTGPGRDLYGCLYPEVQRMNAQLLSILSEEEREQFDGMFSRLERHAQSWVAQADLPKADRRRSKRN